MKIARIETIVSRIELSNPVRIATKLIDHRYYVISTITTDSGLSGWGYCWGVPAVANVIQHDLSPILIGENPMKTEWLWNKMYSGISTFGRRGISARAIGVIDIALWDLKAKAAGLPLHELIGGYRQRVPAYYSGGYYPPTVSEDNELISHIEAEFGKYYDKGFRAFKMKIGGVHPGLDMARIRKAREVIGPESELMLDANLGYSPEQAIAMASKFEPFQVKWFEEPIPVDDIYGLARVREKTSIPIAIGENHAMRWDFREMIEKKAADVFQGDPTLMGGVSEWLKLVGMASSFGITLCPHWSHDFNVQVGAASPAVEIMEYFDVEADIFQFGKLLENPVIAVEGHIEPPDAPGHGLRLDSSAVKRYTVT